MTYSNSPASAGPPANADLLPVPWADSWSSAGKGGRRPPRASMTRWAAPAELLEIVSAHPGRMHCLHPSAVIAARSRSARTTAPSSRALTRRIGGAPGDVPADRTGLGVVEATTPPLFSCCLADAPGRTPRRSARPQRVRSKLCWSCFGIGRSVVCCPMKLRRVRTTSWECSPERPAGRAGAGGGSPAPA